MEPIKTSDLNKAQRGMLDFVMHQLRNAGRSWSVVSAVPIQHERVRIVCGLDLRLSVGPVPGGELRMLCVSERKIDRPTNTWWRPPADPADYDLVAVFYGPAKDPGAVWNRSGGNPYKDDYRRLTTPDNIVEHPTVRGAYREVSDHFTEALLTRLVEEVSEALR
jgi:hypothetical protein